MKNSQRWFFFVYLCLDRIDPVAREGGKNTGDEKLALSGLARCCVIWSRVAV